MSQLVPMYRVEKILQDKYPTKPGGGRHRDQTTQPSVTPIQEIIALLRK